METNDKDKRAIDNPGLNKDPTYHKKDDSDFNESDDFHNNDNTTKDKAREKLNPTNGSAFTGEIAI